MFLVLTIYGKLNFLSMARHGVPSRAVADRISRNIGTSERDVHLNLGISNSVIRRAGWGGLPLSAEKIVERISQRVNSHHICQPEQRMPTHERSFPNLIELPELKLGLHLKKSEITNSGLITN